MRERDGSLRDIGEEATTTALSREVCERLAAAYPQIAGHKPQYGDWYFGSDARYEPIGKWNYTPSSEASLVTASDTKDSTPYTYWPSKGDVWCPLLGDLLVVAKPFVLAGHNILVLRCAPSHPDEWEFGPSWDDEWQGVQGVGATPEEAIASWLLARAENGGSAR